MKSQPKKKIRKRKSTDKSEIEIQEVVIKEEEEDEDEEEEDERQMDVNYVDDIKKENDEDPIRRSKRHLDIPSLREGLKKFGGEVTVRLEEIIDEAQMNRINAKLLKQPREKMECPLCGDKFFEILCHLDRHVNRTSHNCSLCSKSFTFKGKLMDHRKYVHGISYSCEICNKRFNHRDNIRIHMATHETVERFVCYICGYLTKRRQCLSVHMMRHEDKWVCRCSVCNRGFFSYSTLEQHMNSHTGEKPFTCEQCGVNYSNSNTLWKHSRKLHPELYNNVFQCKICDKVFMKETSYETHMVNLHSKGNHFECDSCSKTFKREQSLLIHKRTHTNERPYSCSLCGGAFTARKYLTKHMGVHKAKNYKCRFCYKKFMLEQAWMNHERKHEEVR